MGSGLLIREMERERMCGLVDRCTMGNGKRERVGGLGLRN
jgi:hypothetical protein